MKQINTITNEKDRLDRINILGLNELEIDFDANIFTEAACLITDCKASLIGIMSADYQLVQSCVGIDLENIPRQDSICNYTILDSNVLIIEDTLLDSRSKNNRILNSKNIRFYAGVPLIDNEGYVLGTLCVYDYIPKKISDKQITSLLKLGRNVTKHLLNKRNIQYAEYFLETFQMTNNLICVLDTNFKIKETNPSFKKLFNLNDKSSEETSFTELFTDSFDWKKLKIESSKLEDGLIITTHSYINQNKVEIEWNLKINEKKSEIFCFGRNITKESIEKNRLESSERKFRRFFENSIGLMSLHDLKGKLIGVNEEGRKSLMFTEEEVENLSLYQLVDEHDKFRIDEYLTRTLINKKDSGMMVLKAKDGSQVYWMYRSMLEEDEEGKKYIVNTALNISERILLENENKHIQEILVQTNDVAQVGGWEFNIKTNEIIWSKSTKEIHGFKPDFVPNYKMALDFYDNESKIKIQHLVDRAISHGETYDEELEIKRADNISIWVRVKGIPEFINGECVRIYGIIQNIDKQKRVFLDLETKEAMLQSFIKDVPVTVAMFDKDWKYIAVSKEWKDEFHKDKENIIGENFYDLFPNVSEERKQIYERALLGESYKMENELFCDLQGNPTQHYSWSIQPWFKNEGEIGGVIFYMQNITNIVKSNEELIKAKNLADKASRAKSEFLANMSHEIRTPLNGVIGFSDLLMKTPLNDIQKQYLMYINESGNSLMQIINDVLDLSKIESGKLELFIDKYKLSNLGEHVINVVLYQAQKKNIELLLNVQQDLPQYVWIDEARIKQVLINLIGNAVKFTEAGEIELKIQMLEKNEQKATLRFAVRDTGIGIPVDKKERIFKAFTQEDSSVSKKYGGTGLGLTISNNLLKHMGSSLSLKSELGVGSFFYFDIEVSYEQLSDIESDTIDLENVLVVDDNEKNRIILKQMLSYKGINVELAENGFEAIQLLLKGNTYDAILMDYHMPVMSGIETIEKMKDLLKDKDCNIPLVVLHTSSEEQDVTTSIREKENSYCLLKPIKSNDLYKVLKKASEKENFKKEAEVKKNLKKEFIGKTMNVLLADDNPVNMALGLKIMTEIAPNALLYQAENGAKAVELLKEHHFDLILLDIQMPVMDGIDVTKIIRDIPIYQHTPIIGITAGNILVEREKCLSVGMTNVLPKPIKQIDLFLMLKNYFEVSIFINTEENTDDQILDKNQLEEHFKGDENFKVYFLDVLINELNQSLSYLNQIKGEDNQQAIKHYLHKLKGTAGISGLKQLLEKATYWENKEKLIEVFIMQEDLSKAILKAKDLIYKIKK